MLLIQQINLQPHSWATGSSSRKQGHRPVTVNTILSAADTMMSIVCAFEQLLRVVPESIQCQAARLRGSKQFSDSS